ncbi:hypothetical protein [Paracoccus chinensis]|uniref:Uncharacterized protein n=1 Tax=Paracoccus chinensis TaxID=525640 RepID=A0A1G9GRY7_9RHOB|nr:hypothetical protein [Paracoccus chinensis]SDL03449.1 hypothetical protein SAMN04487971_105189 [Paracoccus chinensis]
MRDFFIDCAERLLVWFTVLALLAVAVAGIGAMLQPFGSFWQGLAILVGGGLYVVLMAGLMFVASGIYRNTQETNDLLSRYPDRRI